MARKATTNKWNAWETPSTTSTAEKAAALSSSWATGGGESLKSGSTQSKTPVTVTNKQTTATKPKTTTATTATTRTTTAAPTTTTAKPVTTQATTEIAPVTRTAQATTAMPPTLYNTGGSAVPSYIPTYTALTPAEIQAQAALQAALKYDPQVSALQNSYELQRQAYENQIASTKANYAGVDSSVQAALQAAEKRALDQSIAMGGGMSGMGTYLAGEAYKSIMPQLAEARAREAAELSGIGNNISLALQQYNNQLQGISSLRGQEEQALITQLQQTDYDRQMQNAALVADVTANINSLNWEQQKWAQQYELQKMGLDAETAAREADRLIEQQRLEMQREAIQAELATAEADRQYKQQLLAMQQQQQEHQAAMDLANLTGYYQGDPTMAMQALTADQMNEIAQILGYYPFATGGTTGTGTQTGTSPTTGTGATTPAPSAPTTPTAPATTAPTPSGGVINQGGYTFDTSQQYGGYDSFEALMAAVEASKNATPTPTTPSAPVATTPSTPTAPPTTTPVTTTPPATPTNPANQTPSAGNTAVKLGDYTFDKSKPYGGYNDFVSMFNDIGTAKGLNVPAPNRKTNIARVNGYNFNAGLPYGGYEDFDSMMQAIEAAATSPPSSSSMVQNGYAFYKDRPYAGYASLDELRNALSHVTDDRILNEFNTQVVQRPKKQ